MAAIDQTSRDNAQLNEDYNEGELQASVASGELEEIMQECQKLKLEISRNNQLQSASRIKSAEMSKQTTALKDDLAAASWALQEARKDEEKLLMQIVTSP